MNKKAIKLAHEDIDAIRFMIDDAEIRGDFEEVKRLHKSLKWAKCTLHAVKRDAKRKEGTHRHDKSYFNDRILISSCTGVF